MSPERQDVIPFPEGEVPSPEPDLPLFGSLRLVREEDLDAKAAVPHAACLMQMSYV